MKIKPTMTFAVVLAATSSLAFAQNGSSGTSVSEKAGVAINGGGAVVGTKQEGREVVGPGHDASTQGANTAGSAEKKGNDTTPGGTMKK